MEENRMLAVNVNGRETRVEAGRTLADVVRSLGADPARVVVERNLVIVPAAELETSAVADGDSVEVIQFVGGG